MPKKSHFTIFAIEKFVQTTRNTCEFHSYCLRSCLGSKWCLVDVFHHKFWVSTQTMVRDYYIAKCKKSSACNGLLMDLWAIFFLIQNIYVDLKPDILTFLSFFF